MLLCWKTYVVKGNTYIVIEDHGILKKGMKLYCVCENNDYYHMLADRPLFDNNDAYNNYFEIKLSKKLMHILSLT